MLREYRALYVDLCVDSYSCNSTNSWVRGSGRDFMNFEHLKFKVVIYTKFGALWIALSALGLLVSWPEWELTIPEYLQPIGKKKENRNSILVQIIYLPTYSALVDIRESSKNKD